MEGLADEIGCRLRTVSGWVSQGVAQPAGFDKVRTMTGRGDSGARIAMSWLMAAKDLGIAVEVKTSWHCSAGGGHKYVHIRDFGGPRGTCACPLECHRTGQWHEWAERTSLKRSLSCFVSFLSSSYETYERDRFTATLDDWQWFGRGTVPSWYTGRPW